MVNKVTKRKSSATTNTAANTTATATTTNTNTNATTTNNTTKHTNKQKRKTGSSSDDDDNDNDEFMDDDTFQDDKPFDEKDFYKLLCDKFPSNYIKSKYNALLDKGDIKPGDAPALHQGSSSVTDLTNISATDIDLEPRKKKKSKDASVFITVVSADNAEENDSDYYNSSDDSDASSVDIDDNISVSSVSSVSSISVASDISDDEVEHTTANNATNNAIYSKLKTAYKADPKNRTLKKLAIVCKNEIKQSTKLAEKYEKKQRTHNKRLFNKVIYNGTADMDDSKYFKHAPITEQKRLIQQAKAINDILKLTKPYRILIMESDLPLLYKSHAMKKINVLESSEPGTSDYNKNKQWVDNFMRIPFDKFVKLPINTENSQRESAAFIVNAKKTLDDTVYGMEDAKMQIMQMIGQLVINPTSVGTAIGICGPPGVGKSTLIKDGVSKILGRPFAMITLGGAADGSFLEGHSYTYEGSIWGRLVQILIESKCMNPIIYFGELDKISGTPRGEEIIGILTHLTDTTQNMQFHDKYFADIDFDFSKAMFIFDYNDETLVNPILRDRLYKIYAKEYTNNDKQIIAANYLLPRICTELKFERNDVIFPKSSITYIIDNFCNNEKGVRNLKRSLETIYRKLNLVRLLVASTTKEDLVVFGKHLDIGNITFPLTIEPLIINKLLERPTSNTSHLMMYA